MWKQMFSMENPVMQALGVACDLLLLNLLGAVCCLPVLTAGPALAALAGTSLLLVRGEEEGVVRTYFRVFRGSLKKGVALGLLFLAAGTVLAVDYRGLPVPRAAPAPAGADGGAAPALRRPVGLPAAGAV